MGSRKKNKHYFNMVEIILAIGILTIGFSSILGLFPVAIKIVRNSQVESLVADSVGDLQAYYYSMAHIPLIDYGASDPKPQIDGEYWYALFFCSLYSNIMPDNVKSKLENTLTTYNYGDYIGSGTKAIRFFADTDIDTLRAKIKPHSGDIRITNSNNQHYLYGPYFLDELRKQIKTYQNASQNVREELGKPTNEFRLISNLNLFCPSLTNAGSAFEQHQSFYLINADEEFENINLTAQILVWTSQMDKFYRTSESGASPTGSNLINYEYGATLNIEVSWPINLPYDEREKRFYQFTIANPKKI